MIDEQIQPIPQQPPPQTQSPSLNSKKRKCLTLGEKQVVLERSDCGESARKIAKDFGCGKTQVQHAIKDRSQILLDIQMFTPSHVKRRRVVTGNEDINNLTFQWFIDAVNRGIPVPGSVLQEKARQFAREKGNFEFKASNGWLESFLKGRRISLKHQRTECSPPATQDIKWPAAFNLQKHFPKCKSKDVLIAKETSLAQLQITVEDGVVHGLVTRQPESRLKLLLCFSTFGEKVKIGIIEEMTEELIAESSFADELGLRPVCRGVESILPVIKGSSFDWLTHVANKMAEESREVLLIHDNGGCTSIPTIAHNNVKIRTYPEEVSNQLDLFANEVCNMLKIKFRSLQLAHLSQKMKDSSVGDLSSEFRNPLKIMNWVGEAWSQVLQSSIELCRVKIGLTWPHDKPVVKMEHGLDYQYISRDVVQLSRGVFRCEFGELAEIAGVDASMEAPRMPEKGIVGQKRPPTQSTVNHTEPTATSSSTHASNGTVDLAQAVKALQQLTQFSVATGCLPLMKSIDAVTAELGEWHARRTTENGEFVNKN